MNNYKILQFNKRWFFVALAFVITFSSCKKTPEYDLQVEGIHYKDLSPIRIGIKDGKIADIKKIKTLNNVSDTIYIGPGLIDNQVNRSEEHTSELQSRPHLVCRLLLEKKNKK